MIYYQRNLGDYAAEAGYLSALEHGVYTLLLDWYHKNERAIPRELVYPISKAISRAEKNAATKVLNTFFKWHPEQGWRHEGAEAAIAKMRDISEKKRAAANQKWHPKGMLMHSECNANAMLSNNQYPITNIQKVAKRPTPSGVTGSGRGDLVPVGEVLRKKFGEKHNV
jgi:uncharacterized protein YdaU (DUF1376 family)